MSTIILTAWVHIFVCASGGTAANDVVLIYSDGDTVALNLMRMTPKDIDSLNEYIHGVKGYTFGEACK